VLIAGGLGDAGYLASVEVYDPATGTFSPTGDLATTRAYHTATALADGTVLVVGGYNDRENTLASAEIYSPTTGTFSPTASLAIGRYLHTASVLDDGTVLVVGGYSTSPSPPTGVGGARGFGPSAEIYNRLTGTFAPTGDMATDRYGLTASVLADGTALAVGGVSTQTGDPALGDPIERAEIYSPTTGTFTPTGSLAAARSSHTATTLADGTVLVAGGYGRDGRNLASAEVYDPQTGTWR
jgi:hypothetical protein